jgi:hypothetical protein
MFIRLTWDKGTLQDISTSCFLDAHALLDHRYKIRAFVRNDNHADVYSISTDSGSDSSRSLEAHVFLCSIEGNWKTYAARKAKRMMKSEKYMDSFGLDHWRVIIMDVTEEQSKDLKRGNYAQDFPPLRRAGSARAGDYNKAALQSHAFTRATYAAVLSWPYLKALYRRSEEAIRRDQEADRLFQLQEERQRRAVKQRAKRQAERQVKRESGNT